jgi:hypothetical protein
MGDGFVLTDGSVRLTEGIESPDYARENFKKAVKNAEPPLQECSQSSFTRPNPFYATQFFFTRTMCQALQVFASTVRKNQRN